MPARTLSHYSIIEKLGEGGMGVVYKARDDRLGRFVALKLIRAGTGADRERKLRFLKEAKAVSALNHRNIVTVYDVGDSEEGPFIAMECVTGEKFSTAMRAKAFPVLKLLKCAIQIADALAAAHTAGIVHRDIKPANLILTTQGEVKVLDFGVAKLLEPAEDTAATTLTEPSATHQGAIVGTVAYMSPEQAAGKPVDARSDIFSLGVVLYEMATGRRPFRGESNSAVLDAIAREDPMQPARVNAAVPPQLDRIIGRCLEKDPAQRFQHAADLKIALEWLGRDLEAGTGGAARFPDPRRRLLLPLSVVAFAAAITAIIVLFRWSAAPVPTAAPEDVVQVTHDLGMTATPALSPDGKLLAYGSDRVNAENLDIWVQQLGAGEPIRRTSHPADESYPAFSPDGSLLVFEREGNGLVVVPALNGGETVVATEGHGGRFSPDGTRILYWTGDIDNAAPSARVLVVPFGGGSPQPIAPEFADARFPLWAPEGKHVLFQGYRAPGEQPEWWVVPVDGGTPVNTGVLAHLRRRGLRPYPGPGDWQGNRIVFSASDGQSRHVWAVRVRLTTWKLDGAAEQLTFGTGAEAAPSLALDGKVAFSSLNYKNNLWKLSLREGQAGRARLARVSQVGAFDIRPSLSAGGKTLAFLSQRAGTRQVWVRDLAGGSEREITVGPGDKSSVAVSSDGSKIGYSVVEDGQPSIYELPATGSPAAAHRLCRECGQPADWTSDGRKLLYTAGRPQSVYLLDTQGGPGIAILRHPEYPLGQPRLSADQKWVVFTAGVGPAATRIFVAPFRGLVEVPAKDWIPVTDGRSWDDKPRWADSRSVLYYSRRDGFGCLWTQRLTSAAMRPAGQPAPVYHFHTLRLSPRTMYPRDFELAVAGDTVVLNLVEIAGNAWLTSALRTRETRPKNP